MVRSYFYLCASMVFVGLTVAVAKVLTDHFPVFLLGSVRCAVAGVTLIPLALMERQLATLPSRDDFRPLIGQALTGIVIFNSFLFYGVRETDALSAGIISSGLPIVVVVLSVFWLKERLTPLKLGAVTIAFAGLLLLNLAGHDGTVGTSRLLGNGLVFAAIISEAAYTIFAKQSAARMRPFTIALYVNGIAFVLFLPLSLPQAFTFDWASPGASMWWLAVAYAITSSVFALVFWYGGIKRVEASVAALFTGIVPLTAGAVAVIGLGETLTGNHLIGAALVLIGVFIGTRRQQMTK